MDVLEQERQKYSDIWTLEEYGEHSPGERCLPVFLDMLDHRGWSPGSLLDAGCGSAKGGLALSRVGFDVTLCDVTEDGVIPEARHLPFRHQCLWHNLKPVAKAGGVYDYAYCCDVLEHIPVALTMLVVARLLAVVRRATFFSISFQPDVMGFWVGKPLHETVMPFAWWRDQLAAVGQLEEARDMLNSGAFLVRPR